MISTGKIRLSALKALLKLQFTKVFLNYDCMMTVDVWYQIDALICFSGGPILAAAEMSWSKEQYMCKDIRVSGFRSPAYCSKEVHFSLLVYVVTKLIAMMNFLPS